MLHQERSTRRLSLPAVAGRERKAWILDVDFAKANRLEDDKQRKPHLDSPSGGESGKEEKGECPSPSAVNTPSGVF